MKKLLLLFSMFLYMETYAQELKPVTKIQTEQSLTKTATITTNTYKGEKVYKSSKGKFFIVKKSKNGNWYKVYLTDKTT
jgi:hypothetical protein